MSLLDGGLAVILLGLTDPRVSVCLISMFFILPRGHTRRPRQRMCLPCALFVVCPQSTLVTSSLPHEVDTFYSLLPHKICSSCLAQVQPEFEDAHDGKGANVEETLMLP